MSVTEFFIQKIDDSSSSEDDSSDDDNASLTNTHQQHYDDSDTWAQRISASDEDEEEEILETFGNNPQRKIVHAPKSRVKSKRLSPRDDEQAPNTNHPLIEAMAQSVKSVENSSHASMPTNALLQQKNSADGKILYVSVNCIILTRKYPRNCRHS